jgi:hypothetical protein
LCIFAVIPGCRGVFFEENVVSQKNIPRQTACDPNVPTHLSMHGGIVSDVIQIEARAEIKSRVLMRPDSHDLIRAMRAGLAGIAGR